MSDLETEASRLGVEARGIPDDVIPVPTGAITITKSADVIFRAAAEKRRMYIRGGIVHEVVTRKDDVLEIIKPERFCSMVEKLGKRVASRQVQKDKEDGPTKIVWRSQTFPKTSAAQVLATDEARIHLPHIRQLSNCPILTPEGEILGQGYHEFNGGTYISAGAMPVEVELDDAVAALLEILQDYDFPSPGDASRAVASLISPAMKMGGHILDDFPLDLAEADQSQSGKTYRQKCACAIYREQASTITKANGGVGSLDESISVAMAHGRPFINIGNFRGSLASAIMEEAIRGNRFLQLRLPGGATPIVDTSVFLWQLSTNGAELTRDMANRAIVTRIRKRPEGYKYQKHLEGDLHAHILARQPAFLGAVFAVVRAWMAAGSPTTTEHRHDFRGWVQPMDWIVQNIFGMDPLLDGHADVQLRTANPKLQWLRGVVNLIVAGDYRGHGLTATDLAEVAEENDLPPPGPKDSREGAETRIGKVLGGMFREAGGEVLTVDSHRFIRQITQTLDPVSRHYREQKVYVIEAL